MKPITVNGLHKNFGGVRAVNDVSFTVEESSIVGLIGPNGSGKSTLFNLITGTIPVDAGEVFIGTQRIDQLTTEEIFDLGIVRAFQVPRLFFGMSVLENTIATARNQRGELFRNVLRPRSWRKQEEELAERAYDLLEFLNLAHVARNRASDLSGGQMKLLELARALMADPKVLLLDEPAAGVVPSLAEEIFERLREYQQQHKLTIVVIEHRLELLFNTVEKVLVMDRGKLIAEGDPRIVSKHPDVIAAYFNRKQGREASDAS